MEDSWQVCERYTVARAVDAGEEKGELTVCKGVWNGLDSSWGATEGK